MAQRLLLALIMALLCITTSFAADDDPVLAKAGEMVFRQSDYDRLMGYSPYQLHNHLKEKPDQRVVLIERVMQSKIIADVAKKEGLDKKNDIREQIQYITDDFLAGEYLKKLSSDEKKTIMLKEDELRQYYIANTNIFTIPEQVKARHILIKVSKDARKDMKAEAREKAKELHRKLKQGEDFEKLAEEFSQDSTTRSKRIRQLCEEGITVRLCKGAYKEPPDVAFPKKQDVDRNYDLLAELLMEAAKKRGSPVLSENGCYPPIPILATHDERRITHALNYAQQIDLPKRAIEFQMLFGIGRDLQESLALQGYPVRVYVPYGTEWYPYYMRRLAERPANIWFFISNLLRH